MCNAHYMAVRTAERDADPDTPRCVEQGCTRAATSKQRCGMHYQAALRDGLVGVPCIVDGCRSSSSSRGLCRRHTARQRRYGIATADLARYDGACEVCGRPADAV